MSSFEEELRNLIGYWQAAGTADEEIVSALIDATEELVEGTDE